MSADNYALIGIHPFAGTDGYHSTLHGVYVGFMSNDYPPSSIPMDAKTFQTHEAAVAYAAGIYTEYGVSLLCDCHRETKKVPAPKKTVRHVIEVYTDTLDHIYTARTAGDFTWKGLLHDFMEEIASTEDE